MAVPLIKHRYTDYNKDRLEIQKFKINYKDVFSMQYLYMLLREWLIENDYAPRDDEKFPETFILQREFPAFGKEIWVRWRTSKLPETESGSKLWRYDLDIDIHVLGLKEVEFMHQGKKQKADKGEVEVNVTANLVLDYEKAWEKHPILRKYKNFIIKKFYGKKFDEHKKGMYFDSLHFQDAIKTYLNIQTYFGEEFEGFWKKRPPEQ